MILAAFNFKDIIGLLEIIIVSCVIFLQIHYFLKASKLIKSYSAVLPSANSLEIFKTKVLESAFNLYKPNELQKQLLSEEGLKDEYNIYNTNSGEASVELSLIKTNELSISENYNKISSTINSYLIRSRNKALDFNMIQDIVDRQINTLEDQIRPLISLPLYLGLMTTMIGIILGLFSMPDLASAMTDNFEKNDSLLNEGITSLIGGVKIAMIASFVGLGLTTLLSTKIFREAQKRVESLKDDFYAFAQIELLPIINESLPATISSLQENLVKFNEGFRENLDKLSGVFGKNTEAIQAQKELFEALDREKIIDVTEHNVKVLKQLEKTTTKIDHLNLYFSQLGDILNNSKSIVDSTNAVLSRTNEIQTIAKEIQTNTTDNREVMKFISADMEHIKELRLDSRKNLADYNVQITDMFDGLLKHMRETTQSISKFTSDEYNAIETALSADRKIFTQLDELHLIKNLLSELVNKLDNSNSDKNQELIIKSISELTNSINNLKRLNVFQPNNSEGQLTPQDPNVEKPIQYIPSDNSELVSKLLTSFENKSEKDLENANLLNQQLKNILILLKSFKAQTNQPDSKYNDSINSGHSINTEESSFSNSAQTLDDNNGLNSDSNDLINVSEINTKPIKNGSFSWFTKWFKRS